MFFIITLFYTALSVIVGMVIWKLIFLRELKLSLIEGIEKELHHKFYEVIHAWWHIVLAKFILPAGNFIIGIFYISVRWIINRALISSHKLRIRLAKWSDMVKGKGVVHGNSSASVFLNTIAEYKKQITGKAKRYIEKK